MDTPTSASSSNDSLPTASVLPTSFFGAQAPTAARPLRKLAYAQPRKSAAKVPISTAPIADTVDPAPASDASSPMHYSDDESSSNCAVQGEENDQSASQISTWEESPQNSQLFENAQVPLVELEEDDYNGKPSPFDLRKFGSGALVSRVVGVDHPEFAQGSLGSWKNPVLSYALLESAVNTTPSDAEGHQSTFPYQPEVTLADLMAAKPHPNAFFSPKSFGWNIVNPWPADSLEPLPRLMGQKGHCIGGAHMSEGMAHSFLPLEKRIDPQFVMDPDNTLKEATPKHQWWMLHTCAACSLSVTCSPEGFISQVVPGPVVEQFEAHIVANPVPSAKGTSKDCLVAAWEVIWKILDNVLLRAETRPLKVETKIFATRVGWGPHR